MSLSRREFLTISGSAALGTLLLSGCGRRNQLRRLYATLTPEEEAKLGLETWYATTCAECSARCGLVVRTVEGRAKKIEGNPFHPVNRGNSCALGQSVLQGLYNPERHRFPMRRSGPRGTTSFTKTSWDEAIDAISPHLGNKTLFIAPPQTGHMHWLITFLMKQLGSEHIYHHEPFGQQRLRWANKVVFGYETLPFYDLSEADLILSFGAPFLEMWLSPVQFSRAYGIFRQGNPDFIRDEDSNRGSLIQIEPRLSLTAANADWWIPVRPGTEGLFALALANRISSPGFEKSYYEKYTPSFVSKQCGIPERQIERVIEILQKANTPLVLGGGLAEGTTNGAFNLMAIQNLNRLLILQNKDVPLRPNPPSPLTDIPRFNQSGDGTGYNSDGKTYQDLEKLGQKILSSSDPPIQSMLIYGVEPISSLPDSSVFRRAVEKIPLIISFSPYQDAASQYADWILPDHTPLESWSINLPESAPGEPVLGIRQPVVKPLFNTRATGDVLLEFINRAGGELPWNNFHDLLQADLDYLFDKNSGRLNVGSAQLFKEKVLSRGGWFNISETKDWKSPEPKPDPVVFPHLSKEQLTNREAVFEGDSMRFPFILLVYPTSVSKGKNRTWLQGTGDPMTTIAWDLWVEIHPDVVSSLGLIEGDLVEVESPYGKLVLPVYPYPGIRRDVVAIPSKRTNSPGRDNIYNNDKDPVKIFSPRMDGLTGDFAWVSTRVQLRPTGDRIRLVKYEGSAGKINSRNVH